MPLDYGMRFRGRTPWKEQVGVFQISNGQYIVRIRKYYINPSNNSVCFTRTTVAKRVYKKNAEKLYLKLVQESEKEKERLLVKIGRI